MVGQLPEHVANFRMTCAAAAKFFRHRGRKKSLALQLIVIFGHEGSALVVLAGAGSESGADVACFFCPLVAVRHLYASPWMWPRPCPGSVFQTSSKNVLAYRQAR